MIGVPFSASRSRTGTRETSIEMIDTRCNPLAWADFAGSRSSGGWAARRPGYGAIHAPPKGEGPLRAYQLPLKQAAGSPKAARSYVGRILAGRIGCQDSDVLALLVSELVANAVIHAREPILLTLVVDRDVVRVDVLDGDPRTDPVVQPPLGQPTAAHGRGLHLIAALASRWGATGSIDGKTVWAEYRLRGAVRPPE
jgi:hypothetical protein